MPDFGPYVRYSDPRVYDLIAGHHWDPFQRSLVLGQHSWSDVRMNRWQTMALHGVQSYLTERGIRIVRSAEHTRDVVLIEVDLPPGDDLVPTRLAEWGISVDRVEVLSFAGPVETVGDVPIFVAMVFGRTEHADGRKRDGMNWDAWIVGRMDVREVERLPEPWVWRSFVGAVVAGDDRVRGSLRKARNTARLVSAAVAEWDEYCRWKEAKDRAAAEAARRAAEAAEPVDEGLMSFEV